MDCRSDPRCRLRREKKKKPPPVLQVVGATRQTVHDKREFPNAPRVLKIDKLRLGLPDGTPRAAFLAAVTVLQSPPPAARRRGSQLRTVISDPENPAGQPQQINNGLMDLVLLVNLGGIGKAFEDSQPRSGVPNVTGSLGFPSLKPVTGPVKMWWRRRRLTPALNQPASGNAGVVSPPLIHGRAFVYGTTRMCRLTGGTLFPDARQLGRALNPPAASPPPTLSHLDNTARPRIPPHPPAPPAAPPCRQASP